MIYDNPPRTIDARMQRVHERILQERGVAVSACGSTGEVDLPDENRSFWRNFDKWNDAPMLAFRRRKASVG